MNLKQCLFGLGISPARPYAGLVLAPGQPCKPCVYKGFVRSESFAGLGTSNNRPKKHTEATKELRTDIKEWAKSHLLNLEIHRKQDLGQITFSMGGIKHIIATNWYDRFLADYLVKILPFAINEAIYLGPENTNHIEDTNTRVVHRLRWTSPELGLSFDLIIKETVLKNKPMLVYDHYETLSVK